LNGFFCENFSREKLLISITNAMICFVLLIGFFFSHTADVERSFARVTADFELKKKLLANEFDTSVSTKLERLSTKCDFYPHELEELRLSLDEMYSRVREARASMINIDFGNSGLITSSLMDDSFEFNDDEMEVPRIITQTKPDIERVLNGPFIRQFVLDTSTKNNGTPLLFDTSNKQVKDKN
jgi:hypothetical protein